VDLSADNRRSESKQLEKRKTITGIEVKPAAFRERDGLGMNKWSKKTKRLCLVAQCRKVTHLSTQARPANVRVQRALGQDTVQSLIDVLTLKHGPEEKKRRQDPTSWGPGDRTKNKI